MAKDIKLNNTEAELKAIAKAAGASLKRHGHAVPHSAVLHAISAALNKRDWHKLKASLSTEPAEKSTAADIQYSEMTTLYLLLAAATGAKVFPVPQNDATALAQAQAAVGKKLSGTVLYRGDAQEAVLDLVTWKLDAGLRTPKEVVDTASFHATLRGGLGVVLTVTYTPGANWYLSAAGMTGLRNQLSSAVGVENLFKSPTQRGETEMQQGPEVSALFWTDDGRIRVEFDARAFLTQAPDIALHSIYSSRFSGDYCTDEIAEYTSEQHLNEDLREGFKYLETVNNARGAHGETVGFECRIDGAQMLRWMALHKEALLADILCLDMDVRLFQSQDLETSGMWDWQDSSGNACDHSFASEKEAAVDAYKALNLLDKAIALT